MIRLKTIVRMTLIAGISTAGVAWAGTGNALDRLNFGDVRSEAWHLYNPGPATMATGALGEIRRNVPAGGSVTFTLACDPVKQTYVSVKLWGNETPCTIDLVGITTLEEGGGNPVFPGRFYYYTYPIPLTLSAGKNSVSLSLSFSGARGVYSVFSHIPPEFVPDSADATGTAPARSGQATLDVLTAAEALGTSASPGILLANRKVIYQSGGYHDDILARQVSSGTAGAPHEVIGLDLFSDLSTWVAANPAATPDQWRNKIAGTRAGPGYTAFSDELLGVLCTGFLAPPFTDANGAVVAGLDQYHDLSLIPKIVAAIDASTYQQGSDGGFIQQGGEWTGLTSTPRTTGAWIGSTARQVTTHGGGDLQGVDTYALGWTIIRILNDPVGGPALQAQLAGSFDADLNGSSMLRAHAWERMLFRVINFYANATGGTESQNMFQMLGLYSSSVALNKLQALYPNAAYVPGPSTYPGTWLAPGTPLDAAKMVMGIIPSTLRGVNPSPLTIPNYGKTRKGLGEAHGSLSTGFDGGGYGQIIPWLAVRIARLATWDTTLSNVDRNAFIERSNAAHDTFVQFLSPLDKATVSNDVITSNTFSFGGEPFITYRDTKTLNTYAGGYNFNEQFIASSPSGPLNNAYAKRGAYLATQYGRTVGLGPSATTPALNYARDLEDYEATVRSLIGVNPATLVPLPGEPGEPDFAFADVEAGAVAFMNQGERFYMNANWRNYESNGNTFANLKPSQIARYHHTTGTIERAGQLVMPTGGGNVQPDGNLSSTTLLAPYVVRYGDYLIVLNNSSSITYQAKLPAGVGQAKDLVTGDFHVLGATVPVAPGAAAIFWLEASGTLVGGSGAPTVAIPASASQTVVSGSGVNLSVLGADNGGEANLTYTWALDGASPGTVVFSANGTSAAKNTTATFTAPGVYDFVVVIQDAGGLAASSGIRVTVNPTATSLGINPPTVTLLNGQGWQFSASLLDQFGRPMEPGQTFSWEVSSGPGAITLLGNYTAPASGSGSATVRVSAGALSAVSTVTIPAAVGNFGATQAIGTPNPAGSATFTGGAYTLQSGNGDLWNYDDDFRFVYQPLSGDGSITARVVSVSNTHVWVKAGVMFRKSLADTSPNAFMLSTPTTTNGVDFQWRTTESGTTGQAKVSGIAPAVWVRLTRLGNTFTAEQAPDSGGTPGPWIQVGFPQIIAMDPTAYVGLALAGNSGTTATAVIDNVTIAPATHSILPFDADVNSSADGSYSEDVSSGQVTINSVSGDLWGTADSCTLAYRNMVADATVTARVVSISSAATNPKVGVTIRDTLAVGSRHASCLITPSQAIRFGRRTTTNGNSAETIQSSYPTPYWLRIVRSGSTFSAWRSPDGTAWTQVGANTSITMGGTVQVGLAVASLGSDATAIFDNITLTGTANTPPTIVTPAAASSSVVTIPSAGLSVLGADSTGGEAGLRYLWNVAGLPPGNVVFSANGSNAAKNVTATFSAGGRYLFQALVTDGGGESVLSEIVAVDVNLAAGAPVNLVAVPGASRATLTWTPSAYATGYQVKRSLVSGGPYTLLASPQDGSYVDSGLAFDTGYFYVVSATNNLGESANSAEASVALVGPPPQPPASLVVAPNSHQITLSWDTVVGATGYRVRRSLSSGGSYQTIASPAGTSFTDTGLANGVVCYYVVASSNSGGDSADSIEVAATPAPQGLFWDTSTAAGLLNGNGTWDTGSTGRWSNSDTGTSNPLLPWLDDDHAFFQTGGTLTATLSGTVNVSSVNQSVTNTATTITGGFLQIRSDTGITNGVGSGNKALIINSPVVLNSPSVTVNNATNAGAVILGGAVSETGGSRAITKSGPGELQFAAPNSYTGGTSITGGQVRISASTANLGTGPITLADGDAGVSTTNRTLYIVNTGYTLGNDLVVQPGTTNKLEYSNNSAAFPLNSSFTGSGTLSLATGFNPVVQLNGDLTGFSGNLILAGNGGTGGYAGAYDLRNTTAIGAGAGTVTLNSAYHSTSAGNVVLLRWNPASPPPAAVIPIGSLAGSFGVGQTAANIRIQNAATSTTATWQIGASNEDGVFSGTIEDGSGTSALEKVGEGRLTLAGPNTYTGPTTINGGILNLTGSLTRIGAVSVNTGGTLAGTGSAAGAVTVASGGTIAPGNNGAGTLTLAGALTLDGGSSLNFELGTASDSLALTSTFTGPASGMVTVNVSALAGFGLGTYPLLTGAAGISVGSFVIGTVPAGFSFSFSASGGVLSLIVSPAAPASLAATGGVNQITLAWAPVAGATSYQVLRSATTRSGFSLVATPATSSFIDGTAPLGIVSFYQVAAVVGAAGPPSPEASAIAVPPLTPGELAGPPVAIEGGVARLSIAVSVVGRSYQLQRSTTLLAESWMNAGTAVAGTGNPLIIEDAEPPSPKCFYRILITP